mgnify:CR=1 FL=1
MDDFNNDGLGYMFIILFIFTCIIVIFLVNYYDLYRFKKCYDNDFIMSYCQKYKNY